jgi:DnaJ-like protein
MTATIAKIAALAKVAETCFPVGNDQALYAARILQLSCFVEYLQTLVEERIRKAQDEGLFDNLPGKGKPLPLDDDSFVPEDLRLAYRILKNSNCLPIELEIRKEIFNLRQLLAAATGAEGKTEIRRQINRLVLRLNAGRRGSAFTDVPQL